MKATIVAIIAAAILIGGAVMITNRGTQPVPPANNVSLVEGKQIIEITAKGGYQPRQSIARAGIPTIIRFNTTGTFDCSSVVRIPSLGISKSLPQTGSTDIDIGEGKLGALQGTCGMGMYPFQIEFQ